MTRRFRRAAAFLPGLACVAVASASAAALSPLPDPAGPEAAGDLAVFAAAGLHDIAERGYRRALAAGDSTAREPLIRVLVAAGRAGDGERLLQEWGGAPALGGEIPFFTTARLHESAGLPEDALRAYLESAAHEPLLADHAAFRAGLVLESLERPDEAVARFEAAADAARVPRLGALAAFRGAGLAAARGDVPRAQALLDRVPPRSAVARADLHDLQATVARAAGDSAAESAALRALVAAAPATDAALRATERLAEVATPGAEDRLAFAKVAMAGRNHARAAEHLRALLGLLRGAADPVREGEARLLLGRVAMARREYTAARAEFARLPEGARRADREAAALDAARCLWRLGQIDACLAEYDAIAGGSFADSVRALAEFEAAREARDDDRHEEAARRFAAFRRLRPAHELADDAAWFEGLALAEAGDTPGALAALLALRAGYPESDRREEAAFWSARAHRDAGDAATACHELAFVRAEYPDGYWAQRALALGRELGCDAAAEAAPPADRDAAEWVSRQPGAGTAPDAARLAALTASEPFRRARALAALGLRDEAEAELEGLRRTVAGDPAQLLLLGEAAWSIGVPREGMRAAASLKSKAGADVLSGTLPPAVARLLYPVAHLDSVRRWAAANDLDPLFVYAVMREESWMDASAVSGAGARGLLQIMPSTGYDLAVRAGLHGFSAADLFVPEVNVRLGARYLRELLDDLDGEPLLALAAYNAGKRNAVRWRADETGFDPDRYVSGITYRETHGYVQKVLRTWAIYRALWGDVLERLPPPGGDGHEG